MSRRAVAPVLALGFALLLVCGSACAESSDTEVPPGGGRVLLEGGWAVPLGDLADGLDAPQGAGSRPGFELGLRWRFALTPAWSLAPSFHYLGYGDATGLGVDYEENLSPTSLFYGLELMLKSTRDGSRPFVGLTPAVVHRRLQGPGKDNVTRDRCQQQRLRPVGPRGRPVRQSRSEHCVPCEPVPILRFLLDGQRTVVQLGHFCPARGLASALAGSLAVELSSTWCPAKTKPPAPVREPAVLLAAMLRPAAPGAAPALHADRLARLTRRAGVRRVRVARRPRRYPGGPGRRHPPRGCGGRVRPRPPACSWWSRKWPTCVHAAAVDALLDHVARDRRTGRRGGPGVRDVDRRGLRRRRRRQQGCRQNGQSQRGVDNRGALHLGALLAAAARAVRFRGPGSMSPLRGPATPGRLHRRCHGSRRHDKRPSCRPNAHHQTRYEISPDSWDNRRFRRSSGKLRRNPLAGAFCHAGSHARLAAGARGADIGGTTGSRGAPRPALAAT